MLSGQGRGEGVQGGTGTEALIPEPMLLIRSSMDVFSNSFAKRPGQYGSTVTLAALMSVAMLSACSQHTRPVSGRGHRWRHACSILYAEQAAHRDIDVVIVENKRSVNARELRGRCHPRKILSSAVWQRALTRKADPHPGGHFSASDPDPAACRTLAAGVSLRSRKIWPEKLQAKR